MNWTLIRAKLREALLALPYFFRNPVQGMRTLPDWDWPTMLLLQGAFAAACASLAHILQRDILGFITGLILAPLSNISIVFIASGFFFYTFLFFFKREIPFRQIYLHVLFAALPVQLVSIISGFVPPVILVGLAAATLLLYVGFTDVFQLDRKRTRNLLAGILAIYLLFWAVSLVRTTTRFERQRMKATPESLDILEKELKFE